MTEQNPFLRLKSLSKWIAAGYIIFISAAASAQNPVYQDFFFDVCGGNPTGLLLVRCNETDAGLGNISGDSEASLNPSQSLSSQNTALDQGQTKNTGGSIEDNKEAGRLSLLFNAKSISFELERTPGTNSERQFNGDASGFDIGFDYQTSESCVVGAFLSYEALEQDFVRLEPAGFFTPQSQAGGTDIDTIGFTFFASKYFNDTWFIEGSLGYKLNEFEFVRSVVFQESNRVLPQVNVNTLGEADGDQTFGSIGISADTSNGAFRFTPHLRFSMLNSSVDTFTEQDVSNSGLNMLVEIGDRSSLTANLGFNASYVIGTSWGVLAPQLRLEYENEFDQDAQEITTSFVLDADNNQLTLLGDEPDETYYNLGLSVVAVFSNGFVGFLDYESVLEYDELDRDRLTLGFRIEL